MAQYRSHLAGAHLIVGQGGRETEQADVFLRRLHLSDGPGDETLDDRAAVVVQKVDLVEDDQTDELGERSLGTLASHDVPLFRRANDHLKRGRCLEKAHRQSKDVFKLLYKTLDLTLNL